LIGWTFNTEDEYPFSLNASNQIDVPGNVLHISIPETFTSDEIVQRGLRLYNKTDHTYTFTEAVEATVKWYFEFADLPEAAKNYITIKAGRAFQIGIVGSQELDGFTQRDEYAALATLRKDDSQVNSHNFLDDTSSQRITNRRR